MKAAKPLAVLVAAGLALAVAAVPAGADPTKQGTFELACSDGQTYTVAGNGNGDFTPVHDTDSNTVFIPLSFGEFNFTITDAQGNVIDTAASPPTPRASRARTPRTRSPAPSRSSGPRGRGRDADVQRQRQRHRLRHAPRRGVGTRAVGGFSTGPADPVPPRLS